MPAPPSRCSPLWYGMICSIILHSAALPNLNFPTAGSEWEDSTTLKRKAQPSARHVAGTQELCNLPMFVHMYVHTYTSSFPLGKTKTRSSTNGCFCGRAQLQQNMQHASAPSLVCFRVRHTTPALLLLLAGVVLFVHITCVKVSCEPVFHGLSSEKKRVVDWHRYK